MTRKLAGLGLLLLVVATALFAIRPAQAVAPAPRPYALYLPIILSVPQPDEITMPDGKVWQLGTAPEDGAPKDFYGQFFAPPTYNLFVAIPYKMMQSLMKRSNTSLQYLHQENGYPGGVWYGWQRELVWTGKTVDAVNTEARNHGLTILYHVKSTDLYDAVFYKSVP